MTPELAVGLSDSMNNVDPLAAYMISNMVWFMIPLMIWELVWKGVALWKSARNSHKYWFVAILILNTAGILPIVYILLNKDKKARK